MPIVVGSVAGTAVDAESKEPIGGATIILLETPFGDATDLTGHFEIPRVPVGKYVVQFSCLYYGTVKTDSITVFQDSVTEVHFSATMTDTVGITVKETHPLW
jgi:hypothetical protein